MRTSPAARHTLRATVAALAAFGLVGSATSSLAVASEAAPSPGAPGIGDPYYSDYGNGGYDVQHYDIKVGYTPKTGLLTGKTTVTERWAVNRVRVHIGTIIRLGEMAYMSSGDFGPEGIAQIFYLSPTYLWYLWFILIFYVAAYPLRRIPPLGIAAVSLAVSLVLPDGGRAGTMTFLAAFFFFGAWCAHNAGMVTRAIGRPWVPVLAAASALPGPQPDSRSRNRSATSSRRVFASGASTDTRTPSPANGRTDRPTASAASANSSVFAPSWSHTKFACVCGTV